MGTPWYNMLTNPLYSNQFAYVSPIAHMRWRLIEDGANDEFMEDDPKVMTPAMRRQREE